MEKFRQMKLHQLLTQLMPMASCLKQKKKLLPKPLLLNLLESQFQRQHLSQRELITETCHQRLQLRPV